MRNFLFFCTRGSARILLCSLIIGSIFVVPAIGQPLSGTKVIGSGGDYATFTAAVTALVTNGVSGPVIFNVKTGSYNEQISIGAVSGTSPTNTVTFRAQSGNAADVTLYFVPTSANNYVVDINEANYITFRNLTVLAQTGTSYGSVFRLRGNADNNNIRRCDLQSFSGSYSYVVIVNGQSIDNLVIDSNAISSGSYGLYFDGYNNSDHSDGIQFTNNTTTNTSVGVFMQYVDSPVITRNTFNNAVTTGIQLNYCNGEVRITKNKITGPGSYGIYLYSCAGGTGFPGGPGLVANNFVQCGSAYGIDIYSSSYQNIYYNSVNATASNGYGYYGYANGTDVIVKNNIFANTGGGYAVYFGNANGASTMDYNNLYTTGNFIGLISSMSTINLDAWRILSGKDANSVSYYPGFTSSTDLKTLSPWLNGKAAVFADVTDDIEGEPRDGSTPDIGADEYNPAVGSTTPLSGAYTIGSGGNYATFKLAVAELQLKGVSGPVTFNVLTGNYQEHIVLHNIPGASATNTITFQANTGNPANATLYFFAAAAESNYVVSMYNADYIRFRKMTLRANNSVGAQYGRIFNMYGSTESFTLDSCIVNGTPDASSSGNYIVLYTANSISRNMTINGNTFNDGGYVLYVDGLNASWPSPNTVVTNNVFNNPDYAGVFLQYHDVPIVNGNTITNPPGFGIQINYGYGNLQVLKNKITGAGNYGIYLYSCIGGTGFPTGPGLVANNYVQCGSAYGIDIYSSSYQNIYYNSVNATASNGYGYYGYANGTDVIVKNNIFANTGGGYAVYFGNANGAATMDYNNLYTPGNFVGLYGSTATIDLDAWRTASGKDANSVSYYPGFTSSTNLHTASPWINGKATPFADVTDDIDGEARDGSTPDIGADEYLPALASMTPLSGSYTIGTGGNYITFKQAVAALQLNGVSGPVTFNVLTGMYNEHIAFYNIPGASPTNTITFQANTGNPANATLYFFATAAESNYVVAMSNADYIRFRKMTLRSNNNVGAQYGRIFYLYGSTENFTLDSCIVYGTPDASSSANFVLIYTSNGLCRNTTINGNTFNDGGFVIYLDGVNSTFLSANTVINNNIFNNPDHAGVFLQYHDLPIVNGNTITNPYNFGIQINYGYNNVQVTKNKITGAGSNGIYLYSCVGGTGFPTAPGLVANNFVQCGSAYGINIYSCSYQNIYYNSVNTTSASGYGYYGYANGTDVIVKNNLFANTGGGYAVYFGNANGASTMDYNNLYTIGNFVGLYGSTATIDLDAWRTASGKDANSVSYYPGFTSSTNLKTLSPWLNGKATVFADVTDDIEGEPRDGSTPDIGADEYDPEPSSMTPLSGTYTIGSGANYATFKLAVADLLLKGVSGPVTFNVLSGTYNEHIVLYNIPGAGRTNTITFQSQTGNPASATLYYPATAADSNYVIQMYQADFFIFRNLTLRANTSISSSYGRVFNLYGGVDHLTIEGNILEGTPASSSSGNYTIVNSNQIVLRSLSIIGNTFKDGGYAMVLDGHGATYRCDSTVVSGNTINNPDYAGIYMQYHNAPLIEGNKIAAPTSKGIELVNCYNGLRITKNKIYDCGYLGIYLNSCVGGVSGDYLPGLVANNFVHCTASSYGIDVYGSANQKVFHNSVHITGNNSYAYYGYNNTTNVVVQNNIFVNTGGGYAVYFGNVNGATTMDYNDLFTTGTYIGYSGSGNVTDLAAWQGATGKDLFSISVNPPFYSPTNLHLTSALLDSTGTPIPEVADDFDGEPRNSVRPDIGADEFSLIVESVKDMESGWNMISLPVMVADNRKIVLYPSTGSDAFAYTPGGYASEDSVQNGVGYWLKYNSIQQNTILGYPKLKDTLDVLTGWNMIGAIAHPVPTGAVVFSTSVISDYFGYNGATGYQSVDTLEPGKGYWVKTIGDGTLILDVNNTKLKSASVSRSESILNQLNMLSFGPAGANKTDRLNTKLYFGTTSEKEIDIDRFSLPPLPPEGVTDVRFASGRYVELLDGEMLMGVKIQISIQGNNVDLKLSWDLKQPLTIFNIVERSGDKIVSKQRMDQTGSMTIRPNGNNSFTIESEPLPSRITLYQNYPNPFNPSTTIRFALPAASPVTVKVFDLLGQEVATLVNEIRPAGEHSVTFDASALSSGIYFYQLRVNNFIESKKLMLVK